MIELPFRQVHLDFHTSPEIPDVAADFDAGEFADTLRRAHVNSVTVFAKCHHGMSYYDTKVGVKHPGLRIDLLGEMVQACHARGIRVPAYISVTWDEWCAQNHPDWLAMDRNGRMWFGGPLEPVWHSICMLNPAYQDYLHSQADEVLRSYEVDGLFLDIWMTPRPTCFCASCMAKMKAAGVNPADDEECRRFNYAEREQMMERFRGLADSVRPGVSVFFNSCLEVGKSDWLRHFTHIEIESLPSGGWGYGHFPLFVRYFRSFSKPCMGMTARFHRSWGDFGGLKNRAALEFECFSMLAAGARCSVGDQLHPRGRLDAAVYELIDSVYESVAEKEPWCTGAQSVAQTALFHAEGLEQAETGAVRMLLETHELFDVIDADGDFTRYVVLILPDAVRLDETLAGKLRDYLAGGGALLLSGKSGLATDRDEFALTETGLRYAGKSDYSPNFLCELAPAIRKGIPEFNYMMYDGGLQVEAMPGTEVLARVGLPYFNRTWEHFCSHGPTPFDRPSEHPAVVRNGRVVYFAHPLFGLYAQQPMRFYRQLLANALDLLRPNKILRASLPSTARVGLTRQPEHERLILHVLNYVPERRAADLDVIEEAQTVVDADVSLMTRKRPARVSAVPQQEPIPYSFQDGCTRVQIPRIDGHAMIVFEGLQ